MILSPHLPPPIPEDYHPYYETRKPISTHNDNIGYKWVSLEPGNRLISPFATGLACVEYKIGEFVEAPEWLLQYNYGLTYFQYKDEAFEWSSGRAHGLSWKLYEVEVEEKIHTPPPICLLQYLATGNFMPYPARQGNDCWFYNTRMCHRIKLVKFVAHLGYRTITSQV